MTDLDTEDPDFPWRPIATAPTSPREGVGLRGPVVLGCDSEGTVGRTFYAPEHPKGEGWLLVEPQGDAPPRLAMWSPTLWVPLPAEFRDRDGMSYEARRMLVRRTP